MGIFSSGWWQANYVLVILAIVAFSPYELFIKYINLVLFIIIQIDVCHPDISLEKSLIQN